MRELLPNAIREAARRGVIIDGTFTEDNSIEPRAIKRTMLLTVEGELDDISGSGQTEAAHSLCTGIVRRQHHHLEAKGAGHYGIFSGRRWRDVVYPHVRAFILEHRSEEHTSELQSH